MNFIEGSKKNPVFTSILAFITIRTPNKRSSARQETGNGNEVPDWGRTPIRLGDGRELFSPLGITPHGQGYRQV